MNINLDRVWLVIHYDWEDSDVVAIAKSQTLAYELRKMYLKDNRGESKNVKVKPYIMNMLGDTIYES